MTPEEIERLILDGVAPDQKEAIQHTEGHARLLAGPGTGKTHVLTRKVLWLVLKEGVNPSDIIALTFTRLAAAQLRDKLREILEPHGFATPRVSTLHSFALQQILHNSKTIRELPSPVRVADDWEERHIIQEDLKRILELPRIDNVQNLIQQLSADWETLKAEEGSWEETFPNPRFLGALEQHKAVYGETLRSELVYRLKRSLDHSGEFKLDQEYHYVLIDEYQDLNACDLAVIRSLSTNGDNVNLFVVGDDDQSIYGFRYADPVGIRRFPEDYKAARLDLEICFRCDKEILKQAEFVASQDVQRLPKKTRAKDDAEEGLVSLVCFSDQEKESQAICDKVEGLIKEGTLPNEIVILSRSNKILEPIKAALETKGIKVSCSLESELEKAKEFRCILSYLRLIANPDDDLAWRTLMQLEHNDIGETKIQAIWQVASSRNARFSSVLNEIVKNPDILGKSGGVVKSFVDETNGRLMELKKIDSTSEVMDQLIAQNTKSDTGSHISNYFRSLLTGSEGQTLDDLLRAISTSTEEMEQETEADAVSVLSMHQAKGLTFDVCIVVGAEDEFIPGRNENEFMGDERRLLYVSMTRARHQLYITYCARRNGTQRFLGRVPEGGQENRNLTRFLKDSKIPVKMVK